MTEAKLEAEWDLINSVVAKIHNANWKQPVNPADMNPIRNLRKPKNTEPRLTLKQTRAIMEGRK